MKFKAKIWKQGNSKIITIPAYFAKQLKVGEQIEVMIERKVIMCRCGKIYSVEDKVDHKCYFTEFDNANQAISARDLLGLA